MEITTIKGGFDENLTYLFYGNDGRAGAIVDAAVDAGRIRKEGGSSFDRFLVTHSHYDHLVGLAGLVAANPDLTVHAWQGLSASALKIPPKRLQPLEHGQEIELAGITMRVLHTPGHSPDGLCFYFPTEGALFTGDTVFVGRTGRTRAANSDTRQLYRSLRDHILPLPDETVIYPGHDYGPTPTSTIGEQRRENKFFQAQDEDDFVRIMEEYEANR